MSPFQSIPVQKGDHTREGKGWIQGPSMSHPWKKGCNGRSLGSPLLGLRETGPMGFPPPSRPAP